MKEEKNTGQMKEGQKSVERKKQRMEGQRKRLEGRMKENKCKGRAQ